MNDKNLAVSGAPAFDPAAAGWKPAEVVGFGELIGPIWQREDSERLRFGIVIALKHLNRSGIMHGGVLMTFADQSLGMTTRRATGGKPHATIELHTQFVGIVRAGEFVEASCEVVRVTHSVVFMQANFAVGSRIVATASGIWKILDER